MPRPHWLTGKERCHQHLQQAVLAYLFFFFFFFAAAAAVKLRPRRRRLFCHGPHKETRAEFPDSFNLSQGSKVCIVGVSQDGKRSYLVILYTCVFLER